MREASPIRILIVDDDPDARHTLVGMLERRGHLAEAVASGEEALARLGVNRACCDVLLVDQVLYGGIDGFEVLRRVKADFSNLPIVLFTGQGDVDSGVEALRQGAYRYVFKPIRPDEIELIIQSVHEVEGLRREKEWLGNLLQISNALLGAHDLDRVLQSIAEATQRTAGFNQVVVSLAKDGEVRVHAMAGLTEDEAEQLRGRAYPGQIFFRPMQDRFRISQSYYVPAGAYDWREEYDGFFIQRDLGVRHDREWQSGDLLRVPIHSPEGEVAGIISVDDPVDRRPPSLETIRALELLAGQAALAIRNAQAMARLRQEQDRYKRVVTSSFDGIIAIDLEGRITDCNDAAERTLGYAHDEIVGESIGLIYHDLSTARRIKNLLHTNSNHRITNERVEVVSKSGEVIPIQLSASLLFDANGQAIGSVGYFEDLRRSQILEKRFYDLLDAVKGIASLRDPEQLAQLILSAALGAVPSATKGSLHRFDPSAQLLDPWITDGYADAVKKIARFAPGEGVAGTVFKTRTPVRVDDAANDERIKRLMPPAFDHGSTICVPLVYQDTALGTLSLDNPDRIQAFTDDDLRLLENYADVAVIALENARQYHRRIQELEGLSLVQKAIIDIGSEADVPAVLNSVVQQAMKILPGVDAITLYYRDREADLLRLGGIDGVQDVASVTAGPPGPESVVGRVLQLDEPHFAPSAPKDEFLNGAFVHREEICSAAAYPLMHGADRVGCMFFNYRQRCEFDEGEKNELALFAQQAALAIHKATLYSEADKRRRRFETVASITPIINATLDPDEVVRAILTQVQRVMPRAGQACMLHYDPQSGDLTIPPVSLEFYHMDAVQQGRTRVSANERSIAGRVARIGEPANVSDVRSDPDYMPVISTTQSELCVPIKAIEELLGVLVLESDQANAFTEDDQRLLEALADQAAIALKKAQEHSQLLKTQDDLAANSAIAWMGLFGSNWAHTVNQRTYQIEGKVYLLRQRLKPLPLQIEEWLNEIDDATSQLKSLPLASQFSLEPQPGEQSVQIDRVLDERVRLWCKKRPEIKLQLELDCGDVRVPIAEGWLEIPLEKLVNNALNAMTSKGQLTVRSMLHGGNVEVQVQDTGKGIPKEIQKKYLLQRPVPKSTSKEGSGLGLLIARKVLEAHSGDLKLLRTALGKGTTFVLHLPVAATSSKGG